MPTPTKGPRLGSGPAHERLMLANLATSLFEHDRITTTEAKAKRLRPLAERLITFAKRGDLHARRRAMTVVRDKDVVHKLFAEIGPRFAQRPGGYTRIIKVGPRKGDNAPMALIELVEGLTVAQQAVGEAERARGTRFAGLRRGSRETGGAAAGGAAEAAAEPVADVAAPAAGAAGPGVEAELGGAELGGAELGGVEPGGVEPGFGVAGEAVGQPAEGAASADAADQTPAEGDADET